MKINTINLNGNSKEIELAESIFASKINKKLVAHVLYSKSANSKLRLAKTKQKNEIKGSTAKIYAQKGTGNARHASRKAPLFVGGGVAHGPKGGGNYKIRKLNKKEKKSSIVSILSEKQSLNKIVIFEDFNEKIKKTKDFFNIIKKFDLKGSLLIIDKNSNKNIELAARNIKFIKMSSPEYLNIHDLLKFKKIVFTSSSLKTVEERYKK
tara:strand:+ start:70 stop:696 length:627 start_codon:yes stop_codon:yes gene_type:complete